MKTKFPTSYGWQVSDEDIQRVISQYNVVGYDVADIQKRLDHSRIENSVMYENTFEHQCCAAENDIVCQLKELGIIKS